jgi:hypothetical protein
VHGWNQGENIARPQYKDTMSGIEKSDKLALQRLIAANCVALIPLVTQMAPVRAYRVEWLQNLVPRNQSPMVSQSNSTNSGALEKGVDSPQAPSFTQEDIGCHSANS